MVCSKSLSFVFLGFLCNGLTRSGYNHLGYYKNYEYNCQLLSREQCDSMATTHEVTILRPVYCAVSDSVCDEETTIGVRKYRPLCGLFLSLDAVVAFTNFY